MTEPEYVYDPLERGTFDAMAYNAIGRASEVGTYPAYGLVHSTGNSGWSVGIVQWDFGQPNRGDKVQPMLDGYQAWAQHDQRFTEREIESLSVRLQTRGQVGNALTEDEKARLDSYLRSDSGREFVDGLNREQIDRKWTNVGEPLSQIPWLQRLRETDPQQAAEIVALTAKLYNQNENRGALLIGHLQQVELTSGQTYAWIGDDGIRGLNPVARAAILSGRDGALSGVRLMNQLETGDGQLSRLWREEVHTNGNVGLTQNFNSNSTAQLLDGMMRNPAAGQRIRGVIDEQSPASHVVIQGINALARQEIARTELNQQGELTVRSPGGTEQRLTPDGWTAEQQQGRPVPQHQQQPRQIDQDDHFGPGRVPGRVPYPRQGAIEPESYANPADRLERATSLNPQDKANYDRAYAVVQAYGGYGETEARNIAAAGLLAMKESRSVGEAQDVGVYGERLRISSFPYGREREPNFNMDVIMSQAAQVPEQQSLRQVEQMTLQQSQTQQQALQVAQEQLQAGPTIGARSLS